LADRLAALSNGQDRAIRKALEDKIVYVQGLRRLGTDVDDVVAQDASRDEQLGPAIAGQGRRSDFRRGSF
jgi:hypothetical protein